MDVTSYSSLGSRHLNVLNSSFAREEDSESLATVKNALADASQTAYVRGQWVYADTGHHGRYRICGAILPGTGDMSAYTLCGKRKLKAYTSYKSLYSTYCLSVKLSSRKRTETQKC